MTIFYKYFIKIFACAIRDPEKKKLWRFNKLHAGTCQCYPGHSYAMQPASINAEIGKFVSIGRNSLIGGGMHALDYVSTSSVFYGEEIKEKNTSVIIGNDVWIGNNVYIKPGLKIGTGAVIGANAVVKKDVPDYAIVAGVPAKLVRYRFSPEVRQRLLASKWWELPLDEIKKLSYREPEKFLDDLEKRQDLSVHKL